MRNYDDKVLLLNATYEPLTVVPWERAVTLVYLGKSQVLEAKDEVVCSSSKKFPKPSVIRLKHKVDMPRLRVKFTRKNVYRRDDFECQYCGKEGEFHELTFDHVVPKSQGGKTTWKNIVTSCYECNIEKKGDDTPKEAGMSLKSKPKEPRWTPIQKIGIQDPPEDWENYLWY